MQITKLKVFGFKSFCEKLDLNIGKGITAIVGPNGCGKSNIIDSIRWVMGEHKNSMLRTEKMEDVIFSGTAKRQALNMAEVSIVINNEDKILPVEYSEVMITRRLFRSGESEYRINKVPCRLKDITTMLLDTGVGTDSYSTIEGKMIDAILSDKTDERRNLFEEAAGISKYKRQRIESIRQLERTTQDLLRINDKVSETERNVHILKRHVQKAQK
jgi:chromosome segregation protein